MKEFSNEIEKSLQILKKGKILLYPTDTVWGIGCDATNELAIKNIFNLKKRSMLKAMIVLVNNISKLSEIVKIPKLAFELINKIKKPLTIVYQNPIKECNLFLSKDKTIAIRLINDPFCNFLIKKFGNPIISTSANYSGDKTPLHFDQIDKNILNNIDYAVNIRRKEKSFYKNSVIIKFLKCGKLEILRK